MTMRSCRSTACQSGIRMVTSGAAVVLAGFAGGCSGGAGDPIGEWAGRLTTDSGSCPTTLPARLLVGTGKLSFLPTGGVLVLHGHRTPDSPRLHAQLLLTDINHKPLPMVFDGTLTPDGSRIDGVYGTPACRAHVALTRPAEHPITRALGG